MQGQFKTPVPRYSCWLCTNEITGVKLELLYMAV